MTFDGVCITEHDKWCKSRLVRWYKREMPELNAACEIRVLRGNVQPPAYAGGSDMDDITVTRDLSSVAFRKLVDVIFGDLVQRNAKLVGAR